MNSGAQSMKRLAMGAWACTFRSDRDEQSYAGEVEREDEKEKVFKIKAENFEFAAGPKIQQ